MVKRPLLRYHGGKWRLAPWIIGHLPAHKVYVEPYGGAASVLLRKERSHAEVYNDLDAEVVNLFRVLRNPAQARELMRLITLTPYSRDEYLESYILASDPIEQARRTTFRFCAAYATGAQKDYGTGFRANVTRDYSTPVDDWRNMPQTLEAIIERLRGVVIENAPAAEVIQRYDTPRTLFYIDPPYMLETRGKRTAGNVYKYEMTDVEHEQLAGVLQGIRGMAIISGYPCDLYDRLYEGWQRVERSSHADGARDRTEVLWISPAAIRQPTLLAI